MICGGGFDITVKVEKLTELEKKSSEIGFWDDTPKAQGIMRELTQLRDEVGIWESISAKLTDTLELVELNDPDLEEELSAEVVEETPVAPMPKKIKETTEYEFNKEEVIEEITNVVSELLAEAQKDVESIRAELSELRGENETLSSENTELNTKVVELSNEPAADEVVLNKFAAVEVKELTKREIGKLSAKDRVRYNLSQLNK